MIRIYCDRCKKQMPEPLGAWALADKMDVGDMIIDVRKVIDCSGSPDAPDEHMTLLMHICPKCNQELSALVKEFMKKECVKK